MTTDETRDQSGNTPAHDVVHAALRDVSSDHERVVGVLRTVTALRAAGLLVEGAPTDEQVERAANAMREQSPARCVVWDDWVWSRFARAALAAAGVAPTSPSEGREKLIADSKSRAQKAFPHRNPYMEGGAYMGEERSRIPLREAYARGYVDAADALAAPTPVIDRE